MKSEGKESINVSYNICNDIVGVNKGEVPSEVCIISLEKRIIFLEYAFQVKTTEDCFVKKKKKDIVLATPWYSKIILAWFQKGKDDIVAKKCKDVTVDFFLPKKDVYTLDVTCEEMIIAWPYSDILSMKTTSTFLKKWKKYVASYTLRYRHIVFLYLQISVDTFFQKLLQSVRKKKREFTHTRLSDIAWKAKIIRKTLIVFVVSCCFLYPFTLAYSAFFLKNTAEKFLVCIHRKYCSLDMIQQKVDTFSIVSSILYYGTKPIFFLKNFFGFDAIFQKEQDMIEMAFHGGKVLFYSMRVVGEMKDAIDKVWLENIYFVDFFEKPSVDVAWKHIIIHGERFLYFFSLYKHSLLYDSWYSQGTMDAYWGDVFENQWKQIIRWLQYFYVHKEVFFDFLWKKQRKTYLIVFQNSDEIRPMWGFMGSVGIASLFMGRIVQFEKKDIYELEWLLKSHEKWGIAFFEKAPPWLDRITSTFWLRDANYFLFPQESTRTIATFLKRIPFNIDGVLYVNHHVLKDILEYYGGVYFPLAKREITSKNVDYMLSLLVESKITKTGTLSTPKAVVFDFMNLYMERIKHSHNYFFLFQILLKHMYENHIFFVPVQKVQDGIPVFWNVLYEIPKRQDYGIDFTYPVFTSISWNKSDRYIQRTFLYEVQASKNHQKTCDYTVRFAIELEHTFSKNEEDTLRKVLYNIGFSLESFIEYMIAIQGKGKHSSYVRVLIPHDAHVLSWEVVSRKYEAYQEVSFYMELEPGEKKIHEFFYRIPGVACNKYEYFFYKQPWILRYDLYIVFNKRRYYRKDYRANISVLFDGTTQQY